MKMIVCKRVSFDAAHYLPNYPGKCANMHGHHWVVELGIKGEVDPNTGMVIDFKELKGVLQPILDTFDHCCLNTTISNPTAENIAQYIFTWVNEHWADMSSVMAMPDFRTDILKVEFIRVWETEDSYAELRLNGQEEKT